MRDQQRARLYAAEAVLQSGTLDSVKECQEYVNKVLGRAYVRKHYQLPKEIKVLDGRRRRSACADFDRDWGYVIRLPRWSRSEQVILHEIAHHVWGSSRGGDHGPRFAAIYLDLVRHMLGADEAAKLQTRFRLFGVRVLSKTGKPRLPQIPKGYEDYAEKIAQKQQAARTKPN